MVNLRYTCCCLADQKTRAPRGVFCLLNVYACTRVVIWWDHGTLRDLSPSGRHSFNFLMGTLSGEVVFGELCLGSSSGFVFSLFTQPHCESSLIPRPDLPFVLSIPSHDVSLSTVLSLTPLLMSLACYFRLGCVFPQPWAGFSSGCLVDCDQRSPSVVFRRCFPSKLYKKIPPPCLLWLCRAPTSDWLFDIPASLWYYAHSNICKYAAGRNTNAAVLLFCMCLLSQVLVFDPSEWDVSSRGPRREQCQLGAWSPVFTWQRPSCTEGRSCSCFYSAAWCSPPWQTVSTVLLFFSAPIWQRAANRKGISWIQEGENVFECF